MELKMLSVEMGVDISSLSFSVSEGWKLHKLLLITHSGENKPQIKRKSQLRDEGTIPCAEWLHSVAAKLGIVRGEQP